MLPGHLLTINSAATGPLSTLAPSIPPTAYTQSTHAGAGGGMGNSLMTYPSIATSLQPTYNAHAANNAYDFSMGTNPQIDGYSVYDPVSDIPGTGHTQITIDPTPRTPRMDLSVVDTAESLGAPRYTLEQLNAISQNLDHRTGSTFSPASSLGSDQTFRDAQQEWSIDSSPAQLATPSEDVTSLNQPLDVFSTPLSSAQHGLEDIEPLDLSSTSPAFSSAATSHRTDLMPVNDHSLVPQPLNVKKSPGPEQEPKRYQAYVTSCDSLTEEEGKLVDRSLNAQPMDTPQTSEPAWKPYQAYASEYTDDSADNRPASVDQPETGLSASEQPQRPPRLEDMASTVDTRGTAPSIRQSGIVTSHPDTETNAQSNWRKSFVETAKKWGWDPKQTQLAAEEATRGLRTATKGLKSDLTSKMHDGMEGLSTKIHGGVEGLNVFFERAGEKTDKFTGDARGTLSQWRGDGKSWFDKTVAKSQTALSGLSGVTDAWKNRPSLWGTGNGKSQKGTGLGTQQTATAAESLLNKSTTGLTNVTGVTAGTGKSRKTSGWFSSFGKGAQTAETKITRGGRSSFWSTTLKDLKSAAAKGNARFVQVPDPTLEPHEWETRVDPSGLKASKASGVTEQSKFQKLVKIWTEGSRR